MDCTGLSPSPWFRLQGSHPHKVCSPGLGSSGFTRGLVLSLAAGPYVERAASLAAPEEGLALGAAACVLPPRCPGSFWWEEAVDPEEVTGGQHCLDAPSSSSSHHGTGQSLAIPHDKGRPMTSTAEGAFGQQQDSCCSPSKRERRAMGCQGWEGGACLGQRAGALYLPHALKPPGYTGSPLTALPNEAAYIGIWLWSCTPYPHPYTPALPCTYTSILIHVYLCHTQHPHMYTYREGLR